MNWLDIISLFLAGISIGISVAVVIVANAGGDK